MLNLTPTSYESSTRTCFVNPSDIEFFTQKSFKELGEECDKSSAAQLYAVVMDVADQVFVYDGWKFNEHYNYGTNPTDPITDREIREVTYFYRILTADIVCDATDLLKEFDFEQLQEAFDWDQKQQQAVGTHLLKLNDPRGFAWLWAASRSCQVVSDIFATLVACTQPECFDQNAFQLLKKEELPEKYKVALSGERFLKVNLNLDWLHESAKIYKFSKFVLGLCYYSGFYVDKDYSKAAKLFTEAKDEIAMANAYLGECYENGHGVERDLSRATQIYQLGVLNKSDFISRIALVELYLEGDYYGIDTEEALEYIEEAVEILTEVDPLYETAVKLREEIKELIHPHSDSDDSDSDRHIDKRQRTPESDFDSVSDNLD